MNIAPVTTATQPLCEDLWQNTMRQTSQTTQDAEGREVSVVSVAPQETGENGVNTVLERVRAQQKNRALKAAAGTDDASGTNGNTGTVATSLENVGPNTYERIRQCAGRTYRAQAMSFAEENTAAASAGLFKSA